MWRLRQLALAARRRADSFREARRLLARQRAWDALLKANGHSKEEQILLHIGCGDIQAKGFINIDARPKPHVHIVTKSLVRLDMIPSESANLIYMSHVLEHVSHREVIETLREMRRILRREGVLRVSAPDFDRIISIYNAMDREITAIEQPLMGGQDYPFNYHYSVFNERHLRSAMLKSGFRSTRSWDPRRCDHHDFEDWASMNIILSGRELPISLNIEAIK